MDSWPADNRIDNLGHVQRKGKVKRKATQSSCHYPHLDSNGAIQAITLYENSGRLKWTSIVNTAKGSTIGNIRASGAITVFPPTRPLPLLHAPRTTTLQRAEQGAHFLRTHFPDVDVAAELIRDEIVEDIKFTHELESFDPYAGNLLEPVIHYDSSSKRMAFLAFPMGELNRELNISPFDYTEKEGAVFKPSVAAVRTFATPIQHLISSNFSSVADKQNNYLAVRTFGSTSLLEVKVAGSSKSRSTVHIAGLTDIMAPDVGNRPVVDVKFLSVPLGAVIVNDHGTVYKCTLAAPKQMQVVHATTDPPLMETQDFFWQLALDDKCDGCIIASNKLVKKLDFRTDANPLDLFSIKQPGDMITCIEDCQIDHITRLSSTSDILWIDERYPRRPLLSYKHGRQFDRSLEIHTLYFKNAPLTCLTSRKNGLVTVYDVSRSDGPLIRVNNSPYCLSSVLNFNAAHVGQAFIRHTSDLGDDGISLFRLDRRGSINRFDLDISRTNEPVKSASPGFEWSAAVKALDTQAGNLRPENGPLSTQDLSEVDLSAIYNELFFGHQEEIDSVVNENPIAVYDLLEKIHLYWQELNAPVDHMLTTYDIVFRSGAEPREASRADFLTQSVLNSTRGYRALALGRFSIQTLLKDALWHHNIVPILKQFESYIAGDLRVIVDDLRHLDLESDPERSIQSVRREAEAREQLALDLVLSSNIFSPQPFSKPISMDETMARATETLSLEEEPPPIDFGYFRPLQRDAADHNSESDEEKLRLPLGVRLLLKDWEIGAEPRDFTYRDPYDSSAEERPATVYSKPMLPSRKAPSLTQNPISQSQRPPLVVASGLIAPTTRPESEEQFLFGTQPQGSTALPRHKPTTGSQVTVADSGFQASSQEFMTSTQILPGPYGGRPSLGKKKSAKKRVGGF